MPRKHLLSVACGWNRPTRANTKTKEPLSKRCPSVSPPRSWTSTRRRARWQRGRSASRAPTAARSSCAHRAHSSCGAVRCGAPSSTTTAGKAAKRVLGWAGQSIAHSLKTCGRNYRVCFLGLFLPRHLVPPTTPGVHQDRRSRQNAAEFRTANRSRAVVSFVSCIVPTPAKDRQPAPHHRVTVRTRWCPNLQKGGGQADFT